MSRTVTTQLSTAGVPGLPLLSEIAKYLKLRVHSSAMSASAVDGVVFQSPSVGMITGAKIGEFTGAVFDDGLDGSGNAVLRVGVGQFGGATLTTSDTPVALVRNATKTTGIIDSTIIEE